VWSLWTLSKTKKLPRMGGKGHASDRGNRPYRDLNAVCLPHLPLARGVPFVVEQSRERLARMLSMDERAHCLAAHRPHGAKSRNGNMDGLSTCSAAIRFESHPRSVFSMTPEVSSEFKWGFARSTNSWLLPQDANRVTREAVCYVENSKRC